MDLLRAVQITLKYAGFFNFPLNHQEIHYWLATPRPIRRSQLKPFLPPILSTQEKRLRLEVSRSSQLKISHAQRLTKFLSFIPGLRMIAITGSVAAGNAYPSDDIDLFFITSPHSLWLVRPVVILIISIFFRRRHPGEDHALAADAFCPNLWLDSFSVSVPANKRNLYTAHEVLQIIPLLDRGNTYRAFLYENRWTKKYLANAYSSLISTLKSSRPTEISQLRSKIYYLFAPINYLFYLLQLLYMLPKKSKETVYLHGAFLHTIDFASAISQHLKMAKDI